MPDSPAQQERKFVSSAGRFVAIGAPLVVVGLAVALLLDGNALGIGVAIALLGAIPLAVGIVLTLTAGVQRRARQDKPWV